MMALPQRPVVDMSELLELAKPRSDRIVLCSLLALAAHAAFTLIPDEEVVRPQAMAPVEIELPAAPPAPEPPEPPETPEPPAPSAAEQTPRLHPVAPAPAAAAAPAVRTALPNPDAAEPAEPFDFTSDPSSTSFGVGVVAVGGRAKVGVAGAKPNGKGAKPKRATNRATSAPGAALARLADLKQKPRLNGSDPCRGYFPGSASNDAASVTVRVVLTAGGSVQSANVVSESVQGQGFGSAAQRCMLNQRFSPGLDHSGQPRATVVAVNVRFRR